MVKLRISYVLGAFAHTYNVRVSGQFRDKCKAIPRASRGARCAVACGVLAVFGLSSTASVRADSVIVAVASNFVQTLDELSARFEQASGHDVVLVSGATGQLYAQIVNGAPYDVFLAADQERPRLLAEAGLGEPATLTTYALGHLALWSRDPTLVGPDTLGRLNEIPFRWLALAEPKIAPYGAAAFEVIDKLGLESAIDDRIVKGQNIAQTFAMVETRNAELGFVALAQAIAYRGAASYERVPDDLYTPVRQDLIILSRARENLAARAFVLFLESAEAARIIEALGYGHPR